MGQKFSRSSKENDSDQYYGKSVFGALPIHFIQDSMDDDLLMFLQSDPFFQTQEVDLESKGYSKAIDYPELTNHIYYEGYYHSRPDPSPFNSMHSRYGHNFDKPAAPIRLTAFLETLRRVNATWTDHIKHELTTLSIDSINPAAAAIHQLLADNRHFGDVSSQIHFGDVVPPARTNFHNDGPNSAIHVALSINGQRSLFWKGSKDVAFRRDVDVYSSTPSGYETHEARQKAGSVYLSSPFIVSHGVAYPQATWEDRVIAVQCRCLFTPSEYSDMRSASEQDWRATMEVLSSCLGRQHETEAHSERTSLSRNDKSSTRTDSKSSPYTPNASQHIFRLPTLSEVRDVYDELLPLWPQDQKKKNEENSSETKTDEKSSAVTQPAVSLVQFMKQNPHDGIADE